jgi:hypothetical protein
MKIKDIVVREDGTATFTTKPLPGAQQIIGADGKAIGTADQATADAMKAAAEKGTLNLGSADGQPTSEEHDDEHHDLVSQGNHDVGGDGTDQFIHDITMDGDINIDEDTPELTPQQQQALAPYLKKDPDGSQYYDYPDTDPKEHGAIMGTKITSPEALAQIKSPQGQADVIKHLIAATDPANAPPAVNSTSTPMSDADAAKAMSDVTEGGMPQSVIKSKQKYADMSDQEFYTAHKDKSEDDLKSMAWRHGYGKGSDHYVNRHKKGKPIAEAKRADDELLEKMRMIAGLG